MHGRKFVDWMGFQPDMKPWKWYTGMGEWGRVGAKHGAALVASTSRFGMKCGRFAGAHYAVGFFSCVLSTVCPIFWTR